MKAYEDLTYEERLEYWSKIDTTKHSEEDIKAVEEMGYDDIVYDDDYDTWTEEDWKIFSDEDMEFWKELKERYQWQEKDVELLREQGNFSEAERVENFTFEEWNEWSENEKEQILSLETALKRHDVAPFSKKKNATNFSEESEEQEYTNSNKGWTKEEWKEIEKEVFEDLERRKREK